MLISKVVIVDEFMFAPLKKTARRLMMNHQASRCKPTKVGYHPSGDEPSSDGFHLVA